MEDTKIFEELKEIFDQYVKPLKNIRDEIGKVFLENISGYRCNKVPAKQFLLSDSAEDAIERLYENFLECRLDIDLLLEVLEEYKQITEEGKEE